MRRLSMISNFQKRFRWAIASLFRGKFTHLYSAIDNPIEVPVQIMAYEFAAANLVHEDDSVLDVGFGTGRGLEILAKKAKNASGIEVDKKAYEYVGSNISKNNLSNISVKLFDGEHIPYNNSSFDLITCVDVIEHVPDYDAFLEELIRVCQNQILISTPVRRPENTKIDGTPKNYWHLREWPFEELRAILEQHNVAIEWYFINGPFEGPLVVSNKLQENTIALSPLIKPVK